MKDMEAKDLRIGNWVRVYGLNPQGEVKQIHSGDFGICELNSEMYEPIQLTEEWLIRANFEALGNGYYQLGDFKLKYQFMGEPYYVMGFTTKPKIKLVHQLQNLYYALTGTEI